MANSYVPRILRPCILCSAVMSLTQFKAKTQRFCSNRCANAAKALTMRGNKFRTGLRPTNALPPGNVPWNKGIKGTHFSPATEFKKGQRPARAKPVGFESTRLDKNGKPRVWVKIAEPNHWQARSVVVWENAHGPLPHGYIVHHKNRDTTDDSLSNLELQTRAEHLNEHREELLEIRRRKSA